MISDSQIFSSIKNRITAAIFLTILIFQLTSFVFHFFQIRSIFFDGVKAEATHVTRPLFRQLEKSMNAIADTKKIPDALPIFVETMGYAELPVLVESYEKINSLKFIDDKSHILWDSSEDAHRKKNGDCCRNLYSDGTMRLEMHDGNICVFVPFYYSDRYFGGIIVSYANTQIVSEINTLLINNLSLFIFFLLLGTMTARFVSGRLTRPIHVLEEEFKTVEGGNLSHPIDIRRKDELGGLAKSFVHMRDVIREKIQVIEEYSHTLEHKVRERTEELNLKNMRLYEAVSDLQNARDAAESANSLKSEFLANMSHEIRTPMNAILGFASMLEEKTADELQKQCISSIKMGGKTLLRLINDILDLSRIEAGKLEIEYQPLNPDAFFNHVKDIFYHDIHLKDLEFILEMDPDLPGLVLLDEVRLRQILLNLIGNAVKFTEIGFIKLRVRKVSSGDDTGRIDMEISVIDTGIGIPEEQKEKIFKAFEQQDGQSHADYGGTGLGLTITKRLSELMGGEIHVESGVGKGSVFSVRLRDVETVSEAEEVKVLNIKDFSGIFFNNALVIVADDIEQNRRLIKGYLEPHNVNIIEAENGKELLELSQLYQPDLIVLDMKMPTLDGCEALKGLKNDNRLKDIPVIAVTSSAMKDNGKKAETDGCESTLQKPLFKNELMSEVMKYLAFSDKAEKAAPEGDSGAADPLFFLPEDITPDNVEKFSGLSAMLSSEMSADFNRIQDTFLFHEIAVFGKKIRALGEEFGYDALTTLGSDLEKYSTDFDVENIYSNLKLFEDIKNKIKQLVQNYKEDRRKEVC